MQQQLQQQQLDPGFSRPATAELRALLASSHSKDGIAERLEHYRKLNSSNDNTDGLDIVHEEGDDETDEEAAELPDWLRASAAAPAACQAAPMVLSMEDPCQSTPEVLQQELALQLDDELDALDLGQLMLLKDAVCRQLAS
ncbi:hypothetical protein OEZ86_001025 [Tetradesmus obliquus]|nr:hypothetical protein OEZ86_001025 [Tetradesmus obliquus]